jgi:hypothetical protein
MRSKGLQVLSALMLGASALTLVSCGSGDGDSARLSQTVDASKNGINSIAIANNDGSVHIKGSFQFNVIGKNAAGQETNLNNKASWKLSNSSLGSVKNGLFKAAGKTGNLTLTVSYAGLSATQDIFLTDVNLNSITVSHPSGQIDVCKNTQFNAEALFNDGKVYDYPLTWKVAGSEPADIARFADANSPMLTTTKSGTVKVVASGVDNDEKVISSPEYNFTVLSTLTGLTLTSTRSLEMRQGQSATVTVTGAYQNGSTENITANASLISSNTGVLTVNQATGVITAASGSTNGTEVTLTASCDTTTERLIIKVLKPVLQKIEIIGKDNENATESLSVSAGGSIEPRVKATYPSSTGINPEIYTGSDTRWEIINTPAGYDSSDVTLDTTTGKISISSSWEPITSMVVTLSVKLVDANNNVLTGSDGSELRDNLQLTINP